MSDDKKNKDYAQQDMKYGSKASRGKVTPPKGYEPTPVKPKVITGFRLPIEEEEEEDDCYDDMEFERDASGTVYLTPKNKEGDQRGVVPIHSLGGAQVPKEDDVHTMDAMQGALTLDEPKEPKMKMILDRLLFDGHDVRTAVKDDGTIWFVLKDVCDVLGIDNNRMVASRLRDNQKAGVSITDVSSNGVEQTREMTIISESGLYSVILKSRSPKAEPFQIWIEEEVLPSIRKTGGYQDVPQFNVPTNFADALLLAYTQTKQLEAATEELAIARPKVEYFDEVLKSSTTMTTTEVAKSLFGRSAMNFNEILVKEKIQYKSGGTYVLFAKYANKGYVEYETSYYPRKNGSVGSKREMRWTEKGKEFLWAKISPVNHMYT